MPDLAQLSTGRWPKLRKLNLQNVVKDTSSPGFVHYIEAAKWGIKLCQLNVDNCNLDVENLKSLAGLSQLQPCKSAA